MKQSEVNQLCHEAAKTFAAHQWILPPEPAWAATDFGLGDYRKAGLVEVLLCNEPEYCEKIMYAAKDMVTPTHSHKVKKEDIICRAGILRVTAWPSSPDQPFAPTVEVPINGKKTVQQSGVPFDVPAGQRITFVPEVWHEFYPAVEGTIVGEVSTFCDEAKDNFFLDPKVDIFHAIEPDEPVNLPK